MSRPPSVARLHASLRGFPGVVVELSPEGIVLDSNGRLEELLEREVIGRPFASLLDSSSRPKWEQVLTGDVELGRDSALELVMVGPKTLELRSFMTVWDEDGSSPLLWLIEYSRDAKLVPLYEKLSAANSELVQVHRELAKERARLARTLALEEDARETAERATARLHALHSVMATALEPISLAETAKRLLARLREALATDTATILLVGPEGNMLDVFASDGLEDEARDAIRLPVGQGFAGRIAQARAPVDLSDLEPGEITGTHFRGTICSATGVPLMIDERLIGVLHVGTTEPRRFSPEDVQLLELVARDVGSAIERARLLERERAARAEAEAAVRLRDEVLAIVAHDLRSPLSGISMAAAMMDKEPLDGDRRTKLITSIRRSAELMSRLIRDLLDAASLQSGRLAVDREPIHVPQLVDQLREIFQSRADEGNVRLEVELAEDVPLIMADHGRLLQVLANLLDNAIRLTPADGRIVIGVRRCRDALQFSVTDSGPGIAPDELPHLFDRFWQGQRSSRGTAGLGLTIAKGIIHAHGGEIWAESVPGHGSAFNIRLAACERAAISHAVDRSATGEA